MENNDKPYIKVDGKVYRKHQSSTVAIWIKRDQPIEELTAYALELEGKVDSPYTQHFSLENSTWVQIKQINDVV